MMNRQGLNKAISNKMQSIGGMNALKSQVTKSMPTGMSYRPSTSQNKARGTMASHTYSPIPNSVSGMGQSGMAAQGSQAGMGIPQPQSSGYSGGVGPKRIA
jgi:hypothetical protein